MNTLLKLHAPCGRYIRWLVTAALLLLLLLTSGRAAGSNSTKRTSAFRATFESPAQRLLDGEQMVRE